MSLIHVKPYNSSQGRNKNADLMRGGFFANVWIGVSSRIQPCSFWLKGIGHSKQLSKTCTVSLAHKKRLHCMQVYYPNLLWMQHRLFQLHVCKQVDKQMVHPKHSGDVWEKAIRECVQVFLCITDHQAVLFPFSLVEKLLKNKMCNFFNGKCHSMTTIISSNHKF